jgi:hypothetical protein
MGYVEIQLSSAHRLTNKRWLSLCKKNLTNKRIVSLAPEGLVAHKRLCLKGKEGK